MMTAAFVSEHFVELVADALFDGMKSGGWTSKLKETMTCTVCGAPSNHAKCNACFREYRVQRNREYRQKKAAA